MNNSVFGKTMENVAKHRNIKLVTTDKRRNYLASEPNYHTTKFFKEDLFAIEMKNRKYSWINYIVYAKTEEIYSDFPKDVKIRFFTSNYELKKVIVLMKNELRETIMKEYVVLIVKTYSYIINGSS